MTLYFTNYSSRVICLNINGGEWFFLQPRQTMPITQLDESTIKVVIKGDCESYVSKSVLKSKMYHLAIESEYILSNVNSGDMFSVTREKIQFSGNTFYDRLFLFAENITVISETNRVLGDEKIKRAFNKSWLIYVFLTGSLATLSGGFITLSFVGLVLLFFFGWKFFALYFVSLYVFLIAANWIIDKIWCAIGKKGFNMKDEKKEFYSYFEKEYITNYYSTSDRVPYMGDVEN